MARGSGRQTEGNTGSGGDRQKDRDKEETERDRERSHIQNFNYSRIVALGPFGPI